MWRTAIFELIAWILRRVRIVRFKAETVCGKRGDMEPIFPFDPLLRSAETESYVMRGGQRAYYRFRAAPYYGGIATADAVGCSFLCAYCWNYGKNLRPESCQEFYSPEDVAYKLLRIAEKRRFRLFRISGAEPILGENSLLHLAEVLRLVLEKRPQSMFILETNGLLLGCRTGFVGKLRFKNLRVRVCLKGVDEESFERITGADRTAFSYPLRALGELQGRGIHAWPALMADFYSDTQISGLEQLLREEEIESKLELEGLEAYPFVMANLRKRGISLPP